MSGISGPSNQRNVQFLIFSIDHPSQPFENDQKLLKMSNKYRFEVINTFLWTVFVRLSGFLGRKGRPMHEMYLNFEIH